MGCPWDALVVPQQEEHKRISDDTYTLIDNPYGYQVNISSNRPVLRSRWIAQRPVPEVQGKAGDPGVVPFE